MFLRKNTNWNNYNYPDPYLYNFQSIVKIRTYKFLFFSGICHSCAYRNWKKKKKNHPTRNKRSPFLLLFSIYIHAFNIEKKEAPQDSPQFAAENNDHFLHVPTTVYTIVRMRTFPFTTFYLFTGIKILLNMYKLGD